MTASARPHGIIAAVMGISLYSISKKPPHRQHASQHHPDQASPSSFCPRTTRYPWQGLQIVVYVVNRPNHRLSPHTQLESLPSGASGQASSVQVEESKMPTLMSLYLPTRHDPRPRHCFLSFSPISRGSASIPASFVSIQSHGSSSCIDATLMLPLRLVSLLGYLRNAVIGTS